MTARPAVFLDRDGTINVPPRPGGYILHADAFHLVPGALRALQRLRDAGFPLVVITNQRCVGIGLLAPDELERIHARMGELLEEGDVRVAGIYVCADDRGSERRKPHPTMLFEAAGELDLDLGASWMIGDSDKDAGAALAAGVGMVLVEHPGTADERRDPFAGPTAEGRLVRVADMAAAADHILAAHAARRGA